MGQKTGYKPGSALYHDGCDVLAQLNVDVGSSYKPQYTHVGCIPVGRLSTCRLAWI
jgi:hypothetical protein